MDCFFDGTSHENDGVSPILGNLHVEMALFVFCFLQLVN